MSNIPIKHYLPKVISQIDEYKEITRIYDLYLNRFWTDVMQPLYDNQFLDSLNEYGCTQNEKILGITASQLDSLEDRRRKIKGYYASNIPYTANKLIEVLSSMCGTNGYELHIDNEQLTVSVAISLASARMLTNVAEMVRRMVPANVIVNVYLRYNIHGSLKKYTHGQLKNYTHGALKEDILFQEVKAT